MFLRGEESVEGHCNRINLDLNPSYGELSLRV